MRVYEVRTTDKTRNFDPCVFICTDGGIYCESLQSFFEHPTIKTKAQLLDHLDKLMAEGFQVVITDHIPR